MVHPRQVANEPELILTLPDGATTRAGPDMVIGRGRRADVRIDDPRVSSVHAEISWRDGGFVVLARGGRVVVDGQAVAEGRLSCGSRIQLVPGLSMEVQEIHTGEAPEVARTEGRDALRFVWVGVERVEVYRGDGPAPAGLVEGAAARLLSALVGAAEACPWDDLARALWPEDGQLRAQRGPLRSDVWTAIDERRFRNRFDQVLACLRRALALLRDRPMIELRQGRVALRLEITDRLENAPVAPRH